MTFKKALSAEFKQEKTLNPKTAKFKYNTERNISTKFVYRGTGRIKQKRIIFTMFGTFCFLNLKKKIKKK
jgi:hypothetical protein